MYLGLLCLQVMQYRKWSDPQVLSHICFVPGILLSCTTMIELAVLQGIVTILSLLNHINHERPGVLSDVERFSARLLFLYGLAQLWHSPTVALLSINILCAMLTASITVFTNMQPKYWEQLHWVGLHLVPGIWSTVVALYHHSLR